MEWIILLATFLLISVILSGIIRERKIEIRKLPPSLPSLPFVGSLPFLRGFDKVLKYFTEKSKKLGPVFTFKIGRRLCLVLNDNEVLTEALVKNNMTFAGREALFAESHGANPRSKGIVIRNFDAVFRRYHLLSLSILKEFGFGSKQLMQSRILTEVEDLVTFIRSKRSEAFNPKDIMSQATSNIVLNIIFGFREDYKNGLGIFPKLIEKTSTSLEPAIDVAPILRFFPYFKRKYDDYCSATQAIIELIDKYIQEIKTNPQNDSFVMRYLEREGIDYDHEQLLFTARDFMFAGTETTSTTLCWSFILLVNHPAIQKRVQDEIDREVPRSRLPVLDDESRLPYTAATILEIMRFKATIPLALPHITLQDCTLMGYFVPERTMIIPNIYAAHMDSKEWSDPETFRPERFLDESSGIIKKDKVIPFSLGRRSCTGEVLARHELFLFFAGLLQNFIILPPEGQRCIDEDEIFGTVLLPKPFKIRMIPRA